MSSQRSSDHPAEPPEVEQITIFHRPIRREFAALSAAVLAVPPDARRSARSARAVAAHAGLMLDLLREHLHFEGVLLWPALRRRTRVYAELIGLMETRHAAIAALVVPVERGLMEYAVHPAPQIRDRLAVNLAALSQALQEHLALEEAEILPLVLERFTAAECGWQNVTFTRQPTIDQLLRAGALLEEATHDERRGLLRRMPVPMRLAWTLVGTRLYASKVGGVRGLTAG